MKKLLLLSCLVITLSISAKEYKSLEAYKVATGKTEISRADWLTKDREDKSFQWLKACKFNFSYDEGHKHYQTLEEREAFLHWVSHFLEEQGHQVGYGAMATEMIVTLDVIKSNFFSDGLENFVTKLNANYFVHAFKSLQALWAGNKILKGEEAKAFDSEHITWEQTQIFQQYINTLGADDLEKLNKFLDRKGFRAKRAIDESLEFPGDIEDLKQRIYWVENKLLPYSKTVHAKK